LTGWHPVACCGHRGDLVQGRECDEKMKSRKLLKQLQTN
jgi:hypothetical protein